MKPCPFCAEEIQDAAIVCRFCNRELTPTVAAPPRPLRTGLPLWFKVVGGLVLAVIVISALPSGRGTTVVPAELRKLNLSGGRGVSGLQVTNLEQGDLRACDVTVHSAGVEWYAAIPSSISHLQTQSLRWSEFKSNGEAMPGYIGQNTRAFVVSCRDSNDARRETSLIFDE